MSRRCDYYFLCDARIQESLSEGGGGGGDCRKSTATKLFLTLNRFYSFTGGGGGGGGPTFFRGPTFSRGGVSMLISIKTHITCDFPEGSGPPVLPLDPHMFELSLPLEVSKSIPSHCHCH